MNKTSNEVNQTFPMRGPMMLGIIVFLILVGGFGYWAVTTKISGAVIASGQIVVDQNRQVVQHPDGGVVDEILVEEGDLVEAGQPLIVLDPTLIQSELTIVEGQYFELVARRARLDAERDDAAEVVFDQALLEEAELDPTIADLVDGQLSLFEARRASIAREVEQMRKRADQISEQVKGIDSQQDALATQMSLIASELADQQTLLDRGLAQASRVLSLQREQARLAGLVGELTAQKAQAGERITEIEIEVLKLESRRREEAITTLRDLQYRERELAEQRRALDERLSRMVITAPVSGVVYGMQVFAERSVIRPADPVMYLVPQDRPLVISSQVPTIHIDQIHIGQEVALKFSSLDQRQSPELYGSVVKVSPDAFTDETTKMSFYRVELRLRDGEITRLPPETTLIPGMPVEAFIRTADRTPASYLTKPFMDYFAKAFRE